MRYPFVTCDVFTDVRFGGNQLAVLPEAAGLTDRQMLDIAREFNYSETTFVLPPERGFTRRVRIFTPTGELPFAGHPNVGTAFVLATTGGLGKLDEALTVTFEEAAGLVPIAIRRRPDGVVWCELAAPQPLSLGMAVPAATVAAAVSLATEEIDTKVHSPTVASVGLPFLFARVRDRAALTRARPDVPGFQALADLGLDPAHVHLYLESADDFDLRVRNFSPLDGILEDAATGSANVALAALLAYHEPAGDGAFSWRTAQGVEMGRPSVLDARAEKRAGAVTGAWIGGQSVLVSEGTIEV